MRARGAAPDLLTRLGGRLSQYCGVEADVVDIARVTPVLGCEIVLDVGNHVLVGAFGRAVHEWLLLHPDPAG